MLRNLCVLMMFSAILVVTCPGCHEAVSSQTLALQKKFTVSTAPQGTISVSKVIKQLHEAGAGATSDVVVQGRIHAGDLPPWEPGVASFVLTDATGHDGEDDHDPHTCPFCSRNIKDYLAKVVFLDESGKPVAVDSRELFSVVEKQLVIVSGKGALNDDGMLVIQASSFYALPSKK